MSIVQTPGGYYYVEGRNGKPGRSFPKAREAQAYDKELDTCQCLPNATNDDALEAADYLADVVEAYLEALNAGVLHAEMELRNACTAYRSTRG